MAELKPYRDRLAVRRRKNPKNPAWAILAGRWGIVTGNAEKVLAAHAAGRAGARAGVLAAGHIRRLAAEVAPQVVIDTALAMFAMREARPHRFRSDRAFDFQVVRRVRGLAESNAGTYFDQPTGKAKRVYRDILPGTMVRLAVPLKEAFGAAGLQLAALDQRDEQKRLAEGAALMAALKDMA